MAADSPTGQRPTQIIIQEKKTMFGRYGKLLMVLLVLSVFFSISCYSRYSSYFGDLEAPTEVFHSGKRTAGDKIAVIRVTGIISENDSFIKKQIDRVRKDKNVKAVVLRINSPGGTVTYSDYLLHHLRQLANGEGQPVGEEPRKLPIVVSMGSVCASGGYYLASAVGEEPDTIFAEPSTITGSIGVIISHYDLSGLLDSWNVVDDSIVSHPLKDMGTPTKTMTDEERQLFQDLVDEMLVDFKEHIKAGRPMFRDNPDKLDEIATGQIFSAKQAEELQLVDKIGFIESAIERAAELAKLKTDDVRVVQYERTPTAIDALLGASTSRSPAITIDTNTLLDLSTPRAYYLWSGIPSLISTKR